jgi:hypothetical protein
MPFAMINRGNDMLTTVPVDHVAKTTAKDIATSASKHTEVPQYTPDGCGVILLFHTPDHQIHGLGGLRDNPALKNSTTVNGTPFPAQVNTTIGGRLFDSSLTLLDSVLNAVKYKMFFDPEVTEQSPIYEAQQVIKSLIKAIEASEGWGQEVCVHTDRWTNEDKSIGTMCFLTAIKHINCTDEDLKKITTALNTIMEYKLSKGELPRNITNFGFYPFINTMKNATAEYMIKHTELEKAEIAYKNNAFVTFNDLCLETFRENNAFAKVNQGSCELSPPEMNTDLVKKM